YGLRPEGYDSWVYREPQGGGEVTIPYVFTPEGELLVGLLREARANMGDQPVWCVIGGFVDAGESHEQAQVREASEEAGLDARKAQVLPGLPTNANRAFFVADAINNEGVHAFRLKINFNQLEPDGQCWKLKDSALLPSFKKGADLRFFRWNEAITGSADGLARSAIAQLVAHLLAGIRFHGCRTQDEVKV
ncbi:MAG: NUDIX hydrolase, partial [bacterium]|nr:NUDIX hydrolase [bacterium]